MHSNAITNVGAKALAAVLVSNNTLREISLRRNLIGTDGANALDNALRVNRSVMVFALNENQFGQELLDQINDIQKRNHEKDALFRNGILGFGTLTPDTPTDVIEVLTNELYNLDPNLLRKIWF